MMRSVWETGRDSSEVLSIDSLQFENPAGMLPDSSDAESDEVDDQVNQVEGQVSGIVLGFSPGAATFEELFPPPNHITTLWRIFSDNIHPVTMLLHAPTVKDQFTTASKGHGSASKEVEALLFAVCTIALVSMTETDCKQKLAPEKAFLLARYRSGTELALVKSRYLTSSSSTVLQAFTLHLVR